MPTAVEQPLNLFDSVKRVLKLQGQRSSLFRELDNVFEDYINRSLSDGHYKFKVSQITRKFAGISSEIIDLQRALATNNSEQFNTFVKLIVRLQEQEKLHLESVVKYQISRGETCRGMRDLSDAVCESQICANLARASIRDVMEELYSELAEL